MAVDRTTTGHPAGMPSPSRRCFLEVGLGATIGVPIQHRLTRRSGMSGPSVLHADRHLFAECAAFDRLEAETRALKSDLSLHDASAYDRLLAEQGFWLDRIADRRATTLSGIRRKTSTLLSWADDLLDPTDLWDRRLAGSILRDLRGLEPGAIA